MLAHPTSKTLWQILGSFAQATSQSYPQNPNALHRIQTLALDYTDFAVEWEGFPWKQTKRKAWHSFVLTARAIFHFFSSKYTVLARVRRVPLRSYHSGFGVAPLHPESRLCWSIGLVLKALAPFASRHIIVAEPQLHHSVHPMNYSVATSSKLEIRSTQTVTYHSSLFWTWKFLIDGCIPPAYAKKSLVTIDPLLPGTGSGPWPSPWSLVSDPRPGPSYCSLALHVVPAS